MTTKIGGIVIDIDARMAKLEKSLAKSQNDLRRFERNAGRTGKRVEGHVRGMDSSFASLKTGLAGLAAGVGTQGLINLGKFALNFADDLATAAERANISVESFQAYKEVFRELEVDAAGFDKALNRLNGTMGDVQRGVTDEATKALDAMGVSARIVSGEITQTDQLLDAIAGAAKDFGTEAEFMSASVDIFGQRLGGQLAPALYRGTDALEAMKIEAIATGKVVDEEIIMKLAEANEVVESFSIQGRNAFITFAGGAISEINRLGDEITGLKLIMEDRGFFAAFFADLGEARSAARLARGEFDNGLGSTAGSVLDLLPTFGAKTKVRAAPAKTGGKARAASSRSAATRGKSGLSEEKRLTQEFQKQTAENQKILELQTMRFDGSELGADIEQKLWDLKKRFPKLEAGRLEILKAQSAQILIQADRYKEVEGILSGFQDSEILAADQDAVNDGLKALLQANGFAADGIEAANVRIAKSFKDTAMDTLASIDQVTSAVQSGGFLGILSAVIGLGLQLGGAGLFGSKIAGNINKPIKGYARGTNNAPAGLALVGEEGPELVMFGGGESVVPNSALSGGSRAIPSGMTSIRIEPSPYFDAVVDDRAAGIAAPMAVQGALSGSQLASDRASKQARNTIP